MRWRGLSEAPGSHLRHRISVLPSLRLMGLQSIEGEGGQYRNTVLIDQGNGHSGRLTSHLLSLEVSKPPFCLEQRLDVDIQRPDPILFLTSPLKESVCVCVLNSFHISTTIFISRLVLF